MKQITCCFFTNADAAFWLRVDIPAARNNDSDELDPDKAANVAVAVAVAVATALGPDTEADTETGAAASFSVVSDSNILACCANLEAR